MNQTLHIFYTFIDEFIKNIERKYTNLESYFRGFLANKFKDWHRKLLTNANKMMTNALSLDENIEEGITLKDCLAENEDIVLWYSKEDISDRFLNNDTVLLKKKKKLVIIERYNGLTFIQISKKYNLTYKLVIAIYQQALKKIKNYID